MVEYKWELRECGGKGSVLRGDGKVLRINGDEAVNKSVHADLGN